MALSLIETAIGKRWRRSPLDLPLLALGGAVLISAAFSIDPKYSLHSIKRELFPFLVLFWGTWNWATTRERRKELTLTLIISVLLVVFFSAIAGKYQGPRFKGIFPYPTQVGKYMDMMIPLMAGVASSAWYPLWQRAVTLFLLLSSVIMVELSLTRTSMALIFPTLGTIAASIHKKAGWIIAALCLLVLVFSAIISQQIRKRFYPLVVSPSVVLKKDPALRERYRIYRSTIDMIKTRPLVGWGYGRHISRKIISRDPSKGLTPFWHSHNILLEVGLQCGVVGLIPFLWLLVVLFKEALALFKKAWREEETETIGYIMGLFAIGLHSMVSIPQWGTTLLIAVFMARVIGSNEKAIAA